MKTNLCTSTMIVFFTVNNVTVATKNNFTFVILCIGTIITVSAQVKTRSVANFVINI